MLRLYIFGTGKVARRVIRYIDFEKVSVIAALDNNQELWGKKRKFYYSSNRYQELEIISPLNIMNVAFDAILIATSAYEEIEKQFVAMGVKRDKVVQCYDMQLCNKDHFLRKILINQYFEETENFEINGYKLNLGKNHTLPGFMKCHPLYDRIFEYLAKLKTNERVTKGWIIDIGANVGDSLAYMLNNTDSSFLCIEPTEEFYELLCQNIQEMRESDRARIITRQCYITDNNKEKFISNITGGTACKQKITEGFEKVESFTLEQVLEQENICPQDIQLIKIDTDGYDADCLLSCGDMLKNSMAYLYWENQFVNEEQYKKLLEAYNYLELIGYNTFYFFDNFGNFLCSGNLQTLRQVNNYLKRMIENRSTVTFFYFDVLACKGEGKLVVDKVINEYMGKEL